MSNLNTPFVDVGLEELLDIWKKELLLEFNCHALGTVQSFNSSNMTVNVSLDYYQNYWKLNSQGVKVSVPTPYPALVDCPVVVLGGGKGGLSFPIAANDKCMILFNDRDLDNWFAGQTGAVPATPRLHSISDAMALVWNKVNSGYNATHAVLYNAQSGVGVSTSKVKIYNATTTLNTVLQSVLTHLQTFTTSAGSATTAPQIATAATTLGTALATDVTAIQGLLE